MPAPFPYNARSGVANDPAEAEADNLVAHYTWLARWSDEMDRDGDLDQKKLAQFVHHCGRFRDWHDALEARGSGAEDAIEGAFLRRRMRWPSRGAMQGDLRALHQAAIAFHAWALANAPREFERVAFDENFQTLRAEQIHSPKTPAIEARVRAFRALFN